MDVMPAQHPHIPTKPGFRPKLRYQKMGNGSLHLFDAIIKPMQIISCYPEDIPEEYKNILVCIDTAEMQEWAKKEGGTAVTNEILYKVQKSKIEKGLYDVVNVETKKAINEKSLKKEDAEVLRDSLNV